MRHVDSHNFYVGVSKLWLFVAIQLYWNFKLYCFYFFPNSALPNRGCGLSTDAAYTWTFTVTSLLRANWKIFALNIMTPRHTQAVKSRRTHLFQQIQQCLRSKSLSSLIVKLKSLVAFEIEGLLCKVNSMWLACLERDLILWAKALIGRTND